MINHRTGQNQAVQANTDSENTVQYVVSNSPFLNTEEAAKFVRLNKGTLANMRLYGDGPVFRKHGNRVYYHIDDLNEWSSRRSHANI